MKFKNKTKRISNKIISVYLILLFLLTPILSALPNPFTETKKAQAQIPGYEKVIFLTNSPGSNQTWTVPDDWSDNNKIEVIGGGGGGRAGSTSGSGGGGGGAYAAVTVTGLTPGGSVTYRVGAGGPGGTTAGTSGTAGGDTFFNRTAGSANTCADTVSVCAKGGSGATSATGAAGGAVASNKPANVGWAGGAGGTGSSTGDTGGGGGGAAGPHGIGRTGGAGQAAAPGAGGGGGANGTANGSAGSTNGGAGANNYRGTGSGAGANATTNTAAVAGTNGGGGGGGAATTTTTSLRAGANGGDGSLVWVSTHASDGETPSVATAGPGGGGGGGGATTSNGTGSSGGSGGTYGAGGGGAYQNAGSGAQGIIVITYVPNDVTVKTIFLTDSPGSNQTWTVPDDWSDNNEIIVLGAGGGGRAGSTAGARGGGGGAIATSTVTGLSPGGSVTYRVGAGGTGGVSAGSSGTNGGDTFFNRTAGSANTCADTVSVCAKGGTGGTSATAGGVGGSIASNKPAYAGYNGGAAGSGNNTGDTGGGGGGAASIYGAGRTGGAGQGAAPGAGGGGAGVGGLGSAGSTNGGNGGVSLNGNSNGVGANATTNTAATAGTNGGGGGGGAATTTTTSLRAGANGSSSAVWTQTSDLATIGPGGGGGGGGATTGNGTGSSGGDGGYGAGGGGAYQNAGDGGQGFIIIRYVPVAGVPIITTSATDDITKTTATLNANITSVGSGNASVRGFAYSTNSGLSTGVSTTTENGSFSTGVFDDAVTGLTCGTTYYVRAYATNGTGTGYGTIESFNTSACGITVSGNIYTNEGTTPLDCSSGGNRTVRIKLNGAGNFSGDCSLNTGAYSVSVTGAIVAGDVLTIYIDGETEDAVTVTRAIDGETDLTNISLYQNYLITNHSDSGPITSLNLGQYDGDDDSDIFFTSNAGVLSMSGSYTLLIPSNKTFTPSSNISVPDLKIVGTLNANTNNPNINVTGNLTINSGGSFVRGTGVLKFKGGTTQTITDNNTPKEILGRVSISNSGFDTNWCNISVEDCNTSWLARRKIIINNASSSALTNFPVLVVLNSNNIDYSKTQNSGQDIRFVDADGTTILSHEIEVWNESATSTVWVKVPQIDANSTTDYIWMYYDNDNVGDGQDVVNVWDSNFKSVHHLSNGSTLSASDVTENNVDGTINGATAVAGLVDGGASLNGTSNYISLGQPSAITSITGSMTISAWVNADNIVNRTIFSQQGLSGAMGYSLAIDDSGFPYIEVASNSTTLVTRTSSQAMFVGRWYHLVSVYNATSQTLDIYINGDLQNGTLSGTVPASQHIPSNDINIGRRPIADEYFDGILDDIRVSNTNRSADWIRAEYRTAKNEILTFTPEESQTPSQSSWCDISASVCNSSWLSRRPIYINNASSSALTNFPVLVVLNSNNIDYSKTQNSGQDIRFVDADGTTILSHEIEVWNESATSTVWVKVPQIDANSTTDYIWMYYDNSGYTDPLVSVTDDFNRGSIGSDWDTYLLATLSSNRFTCQDFEYCNISWAADTFTTNLYVQANISVTGSGTSYLDLFGNDSGFGLDCHSGFCNFHGGLESGNWNDVYLEGIFPYNDNDLVRLEKIGNVFLAYRNGSVVWGYDEDVITTSGPFVPALASYAEGVMDNFSAGDIATSSHNVWDSNFISVFHLNEDPANTSGRGVEDSTSIISIGVNDGGLVSGDLVDGVAGKAFEFDGSSGDSVTVGSFGQFDTSSTGTWSFWMKSNGTWGADGDHQGGSQGSAALMSRQDEGTSCSGLIVRADYPASSGYLYSSAYPSSCFGNTVSTADSPFAVLDNDWHHVTVAWNQANGGINYIYVDGVLGYTDTNSAAWSFDGQDLRFGDSSHDFWEEFGGMMDEIRVSNTIRTGDWIRAEYRTGANQMLGFGAEENELAESSPTTLNLGSSIVTGALTIDSGNTLNVNGSNELVIRSDFTNNGTFTKGTGTVTLIPGNVIDPLVISGSGTLDFHNLTITRPDAKIRFKAGKTVTVSGTFTINGADGRLVAIESDSPGSQWTLNLTGSGSVTYGSIKDSACQGGSSNMNVVSSNNRGNNGPCWLIIGSFGGGGNISALGSSGGGGPVGGGSFGGGGGGTGSQNCTGAGVVACDDFNRADGNVGANWTIGVFSPTISNNRATCGQGSEDWCEAVWTANQFSGNHYVQANLYGTRAGISIRVNPVSGNGYYLVCEQNEDSCYLYKWTGEYDEITASIDHTEGGLFRLEMESNDIRVYADGVLVYSFTDNSSPMTGGYPGVSINRDSTATLDNWSAGNLAQSGGGAGGGGGENGGGSP